jgi:GNAT superfamily N-acetyltransferase
METGNHSTFSAPRRARPEEARTIANLWLRSRYASIPAIPAPAHSDDETREWFASVVVASRDVWVIEHDDLPVALLVLADGWVDQLYVDPQWTGRGLGSTLMASQRKSVRSASICGRFRATSRLDASTSGTVSSPSM